MPNQQNSSYSPSLAELNLIFWGGQISNCFTVFGEYIYGKIYMNFFIVFFIWFLTTCNFFKLAFSQNFVIYDKKKVYSKLRSIGEHLGYVNDGGFMRGWMDLLLLLFLNQLSAIEISHDH